MPSPFVTSAATILGGQEQTATQAQAYNQQIQTRALEDQLRRAQLMMQLEDAANQRALVAQQPQDVQTQLNLGVPYGDILKRQQSQKGGRLSADAFRAQALTEKDPTKQRALSLAGDMLENGASEQTVTEFLKVNGLGDKSTAQPFRPFTADGKVQAFEGYDSSGNPKINTLGAAPVSTKLTAHWTSESDENGKPVTVKYLTDAAGNTISRTIEGRGKLSQQESRLLDSTGSAERTMQKLQEDLAQIQSATPFELATQYAKYRAPFGIGGAVDPKFATYFNDLGQVQTDLIGAATSGSSRSYQLISMLKPHIPDPTDPPTRALEKMRGFEMGRFRAAREAILGSGAPVGPAADDSAVSGGTPVYVGGKLVGYTTDGKTMTPVGP